MPRERNTSSVGTGSRQRRLPVRRKIVAEEPARVWSEASVTVAVSVNPSQYVKFTHGLEVTAVDASPATLKQVEAELFKTCEDIVDRRARRLQRLIRQIEAGG